MMNDTYLLRVLCGNCGFMGEIQIFKGVPVTRRECPRCGCFYLTRDDR